MGFIRARAHSENKVSTRSLHVFVYVGIYKDKVDFDWFISGILRLTSALVPLPVFSQRWMRFKTVLLIRPMIYRPRVAGRKNGHGFRFFFISSSSHLTSYKLFRTRYTHHESSARQRWIISLRYFYVGADQFHWNYLPLIENEHFNQFRKVWAIWPRTAYTIGQVNARLNSRNLQIRDYSASDRCMCSLKLNASCGVIRDGLKRVGNRNIIGSVRPTGVAPVLVNYPWFNPGASSDMCHWTVLIPSSTS